MKIIHNGNYDIGSTDFTDIKKYIDDNTLESTYDKLEFYFSNFEEYIEYSNSNKTNLKKYNEYIIYNIGREIDITNFKFTLEIDNIVNHVVNLNELQISGSKAFIQTMFFNVKLESIAQLYNTYGLNLIEANVRNNLIEVDTKKLTFNETLEKNSDAFYLFNNGINLITENSINNKEGSLLFENQNVQIVNGAQTIGAFLRYNTDQKEAHLQGVYVPLRINIINYPENIKGKREKNKFFLEVCREISIKVNSQKEISLFDIKQKELESMGISKEIISTNQNKAQDTRNYVRDFCHIVLNKPGTIKNSLKKIINDPICEEIDFKIEGVQLLGDYIEVNPEYMASKLELFFRESYSSLDMIGLDVEEQEQNEREWNYKVHFVSCDNYVQFNKINSYPIEFYRRFSELCKSELVKIRKEIEKSSLLKEYPYISNHLISVLYRKRNDLFRSEGDLSVEVDEAIKTFEGFTDNFFEYIYFIYQNSNDKLISPYVNWITSLNRMPSQITKKGKSILVNLYENSDKCNGHTEINKNHLEEVLEDRTTIYILMQIYANEEVKNLTLEKKSLEEEYLNILKKRNLYLRDEILNLILLLGKTNEK